MVVRTAHMELRETSAVAVRAAAARAEMLKAQAVMAEVTVVWRRRYHV